MSAAPGREEGGWDGASGEYWRELTLLIVSHLNPKGKTRSADRTNEFSGVQLTSARTAGPGTILYTLANSGFHALGAYWW